MRQTLKNASAKRIIRRTTRTDGQIMLFSSSTPAVDFNPAINGRPPVLQLDRVKQLNELILAQYRMSVFERRIFLKMLELLPATVERVGSQLAVVPVVIDAREIIQDSGLKGESAYSELQKATDSLIRHVSRFLEEDGLLQTGLVSSAKYLKGQGLIQLFIDPRLHPYLLAVKRDLDENIKVLIKFKCRYSQLLFELFIKTSKPEGVLSYSYQELRTYMRIPEGEYERYYDFKVNVLYKAQQELNDYELAFQFTEKRKGRRVIGIQFTFPKLMAFV